MSCSGSRLGCCLLVALAGCDDAPPIPPRHPKHDLLIERGIAHYNGTALGPGVPLQNWIDKLGPPERRKDTWAYWDSLGLAVGSQIGGDPKRPSCLRLVFEPASTRS
jgi:hypothetical protein